MHAIAILTRREEPPAGLTISETLALQGGTKIVLQYYVAIGLDHYFCSTLYKLICNLFKVLYYWREKVVRQSDEYAFYTRDASILINHKQIYFTTFWVSVLRYFIGAIVKTQRQLSLEKEWLAFQFNLILIILHKALMIDGLKFYQKHLLCLKMKACSHDWHLKSLL